MADQASIAEVMFKRTDPLGSGDVAYPEGGMEHRLGTRMPISLPVKLHHAGSTPALGRMLDVSLSGAYVQTSASLKPLACIGIVCDRALSAVAGAPCVTAFVTRVAADGVALEWFEFAPGVIRHLMRREQSQVERGIATSTAARDTRAPLHRPRLSPLRSSRNRAISVAS
jgi:hypothetical protein